MKQKVFWLITIIANVVLECLFVLFDVEILIKIPGSHLKFCVVATIIVISLIGVLFEPPRKTHQAVILSIAIWILIPFVSSLLDSSFNSTFEGTILREAMLAVMASIVGAAFFVMHFFYFAMFVASNVLLFLGWQRFRSAQANAL